MVSRIKPIGDCKSPIQAGEHFTLDFRTVAGRWRETPARHYSAVAVWLVDGGSVALILNPMRCPVAQLRFFRGE
jgi:hypothetical protein